MDLREVVSVNIERDERGRGLLIRVAMPDADADDVADLRGQLAVMERRALDAERAALDAGKANADAIAAAVTDALAKMAKELCDEAESMDRRGLGPDAIGMQRASSLVQERSGRLVVK